MGKEHTPSLADQINAYWRARGREVNARIETHYFPAGVPIAVACPYEVVVSELRNGWPQGRPFQ